MNRRNKAKAASTSAPAKQTPQPSRQPAKAPLSKPEPTSPPKPAPSQLLRKEWKTFEVWFGAERVEKDRRLSERTKEILSSRARNRFQKPDPQEIVRLQTQLNEELAGRARAEWLRRLSVAGLNEEDWTDITASEMEAVVSAFEPPQPQELPASAFAGTSAPPSGPSFVAEEQHWHGGLPGAWDSPSSAAAPPKAAPTKPSPRQAMPTRTTQTPILVSNCRQWALTRC